jgi:endo-1,4-beta-xylanase
VNEDDNLPITRREFARTAGAAGAAALVGALGVAEWRIIERNERNGRASGRYKAATQPAVTGENSLAAHAAKRGLAYGAAVDPQLLDVEGIAGGQSKDGYTQLVAAQAGILVAENAMKWHALRPAPDKFDFELADRMMRFAKLTNKKVRGHNLCWHEWMPGWFAATANKDNARNLLTDHIRTVAGHFRGQLHSWDVVNEAIEPNDGQLDGLRKSPWLELIGPEYIELAFRTAAETDPQAKLAYNDYGIETEAPEESTKRAQVLALLRRLKERGVPIHAMGVQSHLSANGQQPGAGLQSFLNEVSGMGLEVYITEMDVSSTGIKGGTAPRETAVAKVYVDYPALVLADPNVKMLLTWGLTSEYCWINTRDQRWGRFPDIGRQKPLPFDDGFAPTQSFWALRAALDGAPMRA